MTPTRKELDALHGRITDGMARNDTADYAEITSKAFMMMTVQPDDVLGFLSAWPAVSAELAAKDAEIARLRGALKPFADTDLTSEHNGSDFAWDVLRARAALKESNHD